MIYLSYSWDNDETFTMFFFKTQRSSKRFDGSLFLYYIESPKLVLANSRNKKLIKEYQFQKDII